MTFEEWWKTADDDDVFGSGDAKLFARDAWNAALEQAAKHFDGYTWSPYKSPAITIREMITRLAPQRGGIE